MKIKNWKLIVLLTLNTLYSIPFTSSAFADQSVSATVPPRISDFQFAFASTDGQTSVSQGTTLSYKITYGALSSAGINTTTTLVADWNSDTAPNASQLLDYVQGSTSTAYGGASPVVDLSNHTITWTIPNLPNGTTDQTVTFQLRTTSNYTGSNPVNFTIRAKMSNQYVSLTDQTISQTYQFHQVLPGPTPTPTQNPTPTVTLTPAPTNQLSPQNTLLNQSIITSVSFPNISQSHITVSVTNSIPSKITVNYGTSPENLSQTVTTSTYATSANLQLNRLKPHTKYYIQIVALNKDGQQTTSEIFTFTTATISTLPNLDDNIIVISINDNLLFSNSQKQAIATHQGIILNVNSEYEISYTLTRPISLKTIEVVVKSKVLGANTITGIPSITIIVIPMQEKTPNLYVADLKALNPGSYEAFIRITDTNGNTIEKKVSDLKIIQPLTVYAQDTGLPLADARVFLSYYDEDTNSFHPITPALFGNITNPTYTDSLGEIQFTLPAGRYRVEENALFYDKVFTDFTLGLGPSQDFPKLYLKKDPANLLSLFTFTKDYLFDTAAKLTTALHEISLSIRLFHLFSIGILTTFVLVTFLLFSLRSHIHIKHLTIFLLFHLDQLFKRPGKYIFGSVTNEENKPLSQARIEIEDADTSNILMHISSNKSGRFYCKNSFTSRVNLIISKEGYEPVTVSFEKERETSDSGIHVILERGSMHHISLLTYFLRVSGEIVGLFFEVSLVLSLLLEVLFFFLYGFMKTTPYLILSVINIMLWLFYLSERSKK